MKGIYIHIPFCRKACHYCNFHFSTGLKARKLFTKAIISEIELSESSSSPINTLYFGGGTPSVLEEDELYQIKQSLEKKFDLHTLEEFTFEANPDDLNEKFLRFLKELGVNRLSIGTQSFNDNILTKVNRSHTASQAETSVRLARELGFKNISLDLIYGLPGSIESDLKFDLNRIGDIKPEHVSLYSLTIEENTVFGKWHRDGKLPMRSEEEEADQFEYIIEKLEELGYIHYEVSNFSLAGFESKHNQSYWSGEPYLGLGPSAHSYDGKNRWMNVASNPKYFQSLENAKLPRIIDQRTKDDEVNEFILTSLRTKKGLNLEYIYDKWQVDLNILKKPIIFKLVQYGYLQHEKSRLLPTRKGLMIADYMASEMFI